MNRGERRKIDRAVKRLMETRGDNCTLCSREFQHNEKTFGGILDSGEVHLVGNCCSQKLARVVGMGLYLRHHTHLLPKGAKEHPQRSSLDIARSVDALQGAVSQLDQLQTDAMRRAGLPIEKAKILLDANAPWQSDDRIWFEQNQNRMHRLRAAHAQEDQTWLFAVAAPHSHELWVLVRQIEPGKRIRLPFYRDMSVDIPDIDVVIESLFDLCARGKPGRAISVKDVASAALKLQPAKTKQ